MRETEREGDKKREGTGRQSERETEREEGDREKGKRERFRGIRTESVAE